MFNRRFKPGTLIFVSDMADLFGSWVPSRWMKIVLEHVEKFPQTTFLFLTKNPERYLEFVSQIPSNVVLGGRWRRTGATLNMRGTRNASKTCHRCGHVAQVKGGTFRCPSCGIEYNRDLNAAINIAHALTRRMGWEDIPGELADAAGGVKPQPNAGSPQL